MRSATDIALLSRLDGQISPSVIITLIDFILKTSRFQLFTMNGQLTLLYLVLVTVKFKEKFLLMKWKLLVKSQTTMTKKCCRHIVTSCEINCMFSNHWEISWIWIRLFAYVKLFLFKKGSVCLTIDQCKVSNTGQRWI